MTTISQVAQASMASGPLYLGVDVGTGSVRAGLFTARGEKLGYGDHCIKTRNVKSNFHEQSSTDIWRATKSSIRKACAELPDQQALHNIAAIGFDATCSLVACKDDTTYAPLSVIDEVDLDDTTISTPSDPDGDIFNVILWMDKRAIAEADEINSSNAPAVKQVRAHFGGAISPENEPPKLMWLHRHKPSVISDGVFFDLADWLAFRCTEMPTLRSACTVSCKWGWGSNMESTGQWSSAFWKEVGLSQLSDNSFGKIGSRIIAPGEPLGTICSSVAKELGLGSGCIIATPMIDAHAGSLWGTGVMDEMLLQRAPEVTQRLSVIGGTSTCFIQLSKRGLFIHGVWGPFRDAVLGGMHVTEGGQSVSGRLLEYTVRQHAGYKELCEKVGSGRVYEYLTEMTERVVREGKEDPAKDVHVLDYHGGNRSPIGDATLTGMMAGMRMEEGIWDLAVKFRATVQGLCCGARHVVETMREGGHDVRVMMGCGGLFKSEMFVQGLADCVGVPVVMSTEEETVLVGGGILARAAHVKMSGGGMEKEKETGMNAEGLVRAAREMARVGKVIEADESRKEYFERKYAVYRKMHADSVGYKRTMRGDAQSTHGSIG